MALAQKPTFSFSATLVASVGEDMLMMLLARRLVDPTRAQTLLDKRFFLMGFSILLFSKSVDDGAVMLHDPCEQERVVLTREGLAEYYVHGLLYGKRTASEGTRDVRLFKSSY